MLKIEHFFIVLLQFLNFKLIIIFCRFKNFYLTKLTMFIELFSLDKILKICYYILVNEYYKNINLTRKRNTLWEYFLICLLLTTQEA